MEVEHSWEFVVETAALGRFLEGSRKVPGRFLKGHLESQAGVLGAFLCQLGHDVPKEGGSLGGFQLGAKKKNERENFRKKKQKCHLSQQFTMTKEKKT